MSCGCWHTGTVLRTTSFSVSMMETRIVGAIAGDDDLAIRRNPSQSRRSADANGRDHGTLRKVDHRNIRRAGVGDVGALAIGRHRDVIRRAMNADDCTTTELRSASMTLMLLESALAT